jgi:hypothetical protein
VPPSAWLGPTPADIDWHQLVICALTAESEADEMRKKASAED